jgi:hypothetical protein
MDGRVVEIDTGMLRKNYGGSGNALVIEDGEVAVVNQDGSSDLSPISHPVRVGHESIAIDDDGLANILANGEVVDSSIDGTTWKLLRVVSNDRTVFAYFNELPEEEQFVPELAAYKLDRLLGLGMVPVTVRREIGGQPGTLQFDPPATMTERERVTFGKAWITPCPLEKQLRAMYVFDALILNPARAPSSMLYSPDDWLLILVDNGSSFSVDTARPTYLENVELAVGDEWRAALLKLDDDALRAELGDVLDEERLAALGHRRDALVRDSLRTER